MKELSIYVAEALAATPDANRKQIADSVIAQMKVDGEKIAFSTRTDIYKEITNQIGEINNNPPPNGGTSSEETGEPLHPSVMAGAFMMG